MNLGKLVTRPADRCGYDGADLLEGRRRIVLGPTKLMF